MYVVGKEPRSSARIASDPNCQAISADHPHLSISRPLFHWLQKILPTFFLLFYMTWTLNLFKGILLLFSPLVLEIGPESYPCSSSHTVHWAAPHSLIASSVDLCSEITSIKLRANTLPGEGWTRACQTSMASGTARQWVLKLRSQGSLSRIVFPREEEQKG